MASESSVVLGADACTYPKCAIGSAFVPELRGNFFATGNCYYTSEVSPFALFLFTSFMSYRQVVSDTNILLWHSCSSVHTSNRTN